MNQDIQDGATESDAEFKAHLADAYLHPIFHSIEGVELAEVRVDRR